MPAHPAAYAHLANRLRSATDPEAQDQLLDTWLQYRDHATEWDADQWGLAVDQTQEQP